MGKECKVMYMYIFEGVWYFFNSEWVIWVIIVYIFLILVVKVMG